VDRAFADWHWAIVGVGSVAATSVSTFLVWLMLAFGPTGQPDDSLSAVMVNLSTPAGQLYLYAKPDGEDREVLLHFDAGNAAAYPRSAHLPPLTRPGGPRSTAELVGDLTAAVARQGHVIALGRLNPGERRRAHALLNEISQRMVPDTRPMGAAVRVEEVRLLTSTSVTARGL
jgi:hypothetical protein